MVTSNKLPEKKVVKMEDSNSGMVVPQRTLLGEVNEHITCPLCRGYYIDATTIVECLHSFCRSCIIKHLKAKSYCPVCEMMINSAKPNIKLDKALQDIVYKLVPGLFQKEMERRQHFYSSRPGPAASATPEQRGEDTERVIFSPEDVISFSLEYADVTDSDSISSKSSDSNEPPGPTTTRRYLQCPAVVNISHLKKFICMKFDIDSTQFAIDVLYKRVPLPDYYTLMDIAYIYNWKRNEPMRFFYQIIDYVAIRNRIFDINRKGYCQNKSSSVPPEDTNVNSPVPHSDQVSEASSGTDSPMPEENNSKSISDGKKHETEVKNILKESFDKSKADKGGTSSKKSEDEVEKSQFLNSFELTAKSNCVQKTSPVKQGVVVNESTQPKDIVLKNQQNSPKTDEKQPTEVLKRKTHMPFNTPELKKVKVELEKSKSTNFINSPNGTSNAGSGMPSLSSHQNIKANDNKLNVKESELPMKLLQGSSSSSNIGNIAPPIIKEIKQKHTSVTGQTHSSDSSGIKRSVPHHVATSKRKPSDLTPPGQPQSTTPKTISPLKIQVPKIESQPSSPKHLESHKAPVKKIPDLKPSTPTQSKAPPVNKVRMDLLANNSDPTIDRSKILSQVKTSLSSPNVPSTSGDPLKSLFDSCKINIPSSLSITLTDQKLDTRNSTDTVSGDAKKNIVNKNLTSASNSSLTHKVPSPPVHNYIEILKIPDADQKKASKTETGIDSKLNTQHKPDNPSVPNKPANKSTESSAKGPVPNLKPIADTKLAKQSANYGGPITFQQTFEQQLQTLQGDKKAKGPKNKAQVPKLVPVPTTPKSFSAANKPGTFNNNKPSTPTVESKTSTALDLSSPYVQSPSGSAQNFDKAFETMQSIANLAKMQSLPPKMPPSMSQNTGFSSLTNRPTASGPSPLRIPSCNMNQIKLDKSPSGSPLNVPRHESLNKSNTLKSANTLNPTSTPTNYQMPAHASLTAAQPSPRQTRSPSSSPKLVIAEDKQSNHVTLDLNINQSNQITSTQIQNFMASKIESPAMAGPSKPSMKTLKPITQAAKLSTNRQPITPTLKPNPGNLAVDYLRTDIMQHNTYYNMRKQLEMNAAWLKAQRPYDLDLIKNMTNLAHQSQSDFNKDKQ